MLLLQLQAYCNAYKLEDTRMAGGGCGGSCINENVRMHRGLAAG